MYGHRNPILTMTMKHLPILLSLLLLAACQEKKLDRFERETREYTERNCPKEVDAITVLDSMVFHNDGSLNYIYYYTVTLTDEQRETFKAKLDDIKDGVAKGLRNSIEVKAMKEAGLNFVYVYRDAVSGKLVAKYTVTRKEYE